MPANDGLSTDKLYKNDVLRPLFLTDASEDAQLHQPALILINNLSQSFNYLLNYYNY